MIFGDFYHIFILQKLNRVSVNKAAENVVSKCYSQYYSSDVQLQLAAGVGTHDVTVYCRLSFLKTKHANWILEIYNKFSYKGVTIIKSGFRKADITEAIDYNRDGRVSRARPILIYITSFGNLLFH